MSPEQYQRQSQSYRRGYVEGEAGERNVYLLEVGATDIVEYNRGFADGMEMFLIREAEEQSA